MVWEEIDGTGKEELWRDVGERAWLEVVVVVVVVEGEEGVG